MFRVAEFQRSSRVEMAGFAFGPMLERTCRAKNREFWFPSFNSRTRIGTDCLGRSDGSFRLCVGRLIIYGERIEGG